MQLGDVLSLTDADGDGVTLYELWDSEGGDNWLVDGVAVDAAIGFRATGLQTIQIQADAASSTQTLWARVNDGIDWSDWDSFILTAEVNSAPEAEVADQTKAPLEWTQLSDVLTVTDADGDAITRYGLWDDTGGNNWWTEGAGFVDASAGFEVAALSDIWFRADAADSTQILWVRANDGSEWGDWDRFDLVTQVTNAAPVVDIADQTVDKAEWTLLSDVMTVTDAENDEIAFFNLRDDVGSDSWWADGGYVDASVGYQTANLSDIWFQGDVGEGNQTLWVQANDGNDWGDWDMFDLITL